MTATTSRRRRRRIPQRPPSVSLPLASLPLLTLLILWQAKTTTTALLVEGATPRLALDVTFKTNKRDMTKEEGRTIFASHATFGGSLPFGSRSGPPVPPQQQQVMRMILPPADDPYLCGLATNSNATSTSTSMYITAVAMLVPRGQCTFERKAYTAQHHHGAAMVIVRNTLESRYRWNETWFNETRNDANGTEIWANGILWPQSQADYECSVGQTFLPSSLFSFHPPDRSSTGPYNASHNDALLVGSAVDGNLCALGHEAREGKGPFKGCESQRCLITGRAKQDAGIQEGGTGTKGENVQQGGERMAEVCCAWDVHMSMGSDAQIAQGGVTIPVAFVTMAGGDKLFEALVLSEVSSSSNGQDRQGEEGESTMTATVIITVIPYERWCPYPNASTFLLWMLAMLVTALASWLSSWEYRKAERIIRKAKAEGRQVFARTDTNGRGDVAQGAEEGRIVPQPQQNRLQLTGSQLRREPIQVPLASSQAEAPISSSPPAICAQEERRTGEKSSAMEMSFEDEPFDDVSLEEYSSEDSYENTDDDGELSMYDDEYDDEYVEGDNCLCEGPYANGEVPDESLAAPAMAHSEPTPPMPMTERIQQQGMGMYPVDTTSASLSQHTDAATAATQDVSASQQQQPANDYTSARGVGEIDEGPESYTAARQQPPPSEQVVAVPASQSQEWMEIGLKHVIGFVIFASVALFVLFYFEIYRAVTVIYAIGCAGAMAFVVFHPLYRFLARKLGLQGHFGTSVCPKGPCGLGALTYLEVLSVSSGYGVGISWLYIGLTQLNPQDNAYYWVVQNLLGASISIAFLGLIRLSTIKIATVLLLAVFIYDVVMVFITPFFTKEGESVMVTVATSGGPPDDPDFCEKYPTEEECRTGDPLPMLLTIPLINSYRGGAKLLGLGDIVLPGLLIALAARLDDCKRLLKLCADVYRSEIGGPMPRRPSGSTIASSVDDDAGDNQQQSSYESVEESKSGRWDMVKQVIFCGYFVPLMVAYGVGLAMAFLAVHLMERGQPALLYIVPACLGMMTILGIAKGELKEIWDGPKRIQKCDKIVASLRSMF